MAKSINQQIKEAMAKKVVGQTTEIYKAVVLELYQRTTANSLQVGIRYGFPVLTGRYYASHTMARGRIDKTVRVVSADRVHRFGRVILQNLVSFSGMRRIECLDRSVHAGDGHAAPHHGTPHHPALGHPRGTARRRPTAVADDRASDRSAQRKGRSHDDDDVT
jgi:hypothetical protein